ncbi:dynein axonemal intermediate chain 4 [Stomoxys calcitrans]|uniref:dynein axonemal intermediate chain 4 n=1 Tax=Stomoxys calcitrans TaxID=35570 RepID=UPI0027E28262|nr:dynein axonemal intermediate chain 4 [Stomoxys calcitrans]
MSLNPEDYLKDKFEKLNIKINKHETLESQESVKTEELDNLVVPTQKGLGSIRTTLDDIENGVKQSQLNVEMHKVSGCHLRSATRKPIQRINPFIKITLKKTSDIVLYEQRSTTVLKDTEEGRQVEEDNERYTYLTEGQGRKRTYFLKETQTPVVLTKTRAVNTDSIAKDNIGSYVSNFEMFDTYKDLEQTTQSVDVDGQKKMQVTTYKVGGVDQFVDINKKPEFSLALMLTMRILAGNNFETPQRRFRNMTLPDPLALEVRYSYRVDLLWTFSTILQDGDSKAISDLSWCPSHGDILAVSYGTFGSISSIIPQRGCVCVWNIKNPVNPERIYNFKAPVQSVEFSPFAPQLLAIGLYDGSVHVYDISNIQQPQIAMSERLISPCSEPVSCLKWIPHSVSETKLYDIEPFLALARDGSVTRYTLINSPHLLGFPLMQLDRVDGNAEGLLFEIKPSVLEANRHPQAVHMCIDAQQKDVYFVLTDEGCVHKCSTNYPNQQLQVLQLHEAGINYMEFSPWSPKLYLTCGNDWCIRIWLMGIFKPLITLKYHMSPIYSACWSTVHSSIIVALHRDAVDIWDLKRSILQPASSTRIDQTAFYTTLKLTHCGRSVAVGNDKGSVEVLTLEEMPFPPHFQYEHLEKTIYEILANNKDLLRDVKSLGHFGYLKK